MRQLYLLFILLLFPVFAAAQDNPIVARMNSFAAAYNAHDAAAIAEFYTEDGALLPPQSKILSGRQAIAAHYASAFAAGVGNLRFKVLEIRQHGSAAVEIGETFVDAGGRTIHGRYLHVWINQGGEWRLSRDMYHVVGAR